MPDARAAAEHLVDALPFGWRGEREALRRKAHTGQASVGQRTLVRADDKHLARINIIKDFLSRLHYTHKDKQLIQVDANIVFPYDISNLENGQLAK